MPFEDDIRKWATLDTQIAEMNSTIRSLRSEKSEVEDSILRHVEEKSLNNAIVKLSDSKLHFTDTKTTPPLTFKFLRTCLLDIVEDTAEVDEILAYIKNKRETKTTLSIKRCFPD